jgi:hypothetical protein
MAVEAALLLRATQKTTQSRLAVHSTVGQLYTETPASLFKV